MKRSSFNSCLFSSGDVVRVSEGRLLGIVVGTRPFHGEDIWESTVVIQTVMTGQPVTRLAETGAGLVQREVSANKLSLVCRASCNSLEEGDPVVSFPLIRSPHVSEEMRLLEGVFYLSRHTSGTVRAQSLAGGDDFSIRRKTLYLPRNKLAPIKVGDPVTIRVSRQRGWQGYVLDIDERGVLTIKFPTIDKASLSRAAVEEFKMGEVTRNLSCEDLDLGCPDAVYDIDIVTELQRRPVIYRVFVDEVVV